jgi:hypothetical protein
MPVIEKPDANCPLRSQVLIGDPLASQLRDAVRRLPEKKSGPGGLPH